MNPLIATGAAAYAGLGLVSFLKPGVVPAIIGSTAPNADSRTEIRAVYGGLPLAFAATLAASPASGTAIGVATAGMAAGRAGSAVFEGRPSAKMAGLVVGGVGGGGAVRRGARPPRRPGPGWAGRGGTEGTQPKKVRRSPTTSIGTSIAAK